MGWSMIFCIILNAFVNIVIVLGIGGWLVALLCIKYYRISDRKYDGCCEKLTKLFGTKIVEESSSKHSNKVIEVQ